jgi:hypothetical protein
VVVCPNGHDPEPFGVEPDVTKRALRSDNRKLRRRTSTLEFENKRYQGQTLRLTERVEELTTQLAAAERQIATRARSEAVGAAGHLPAIYKAKVCACGAQFTPTGPRNVYCSTCRRS